jgi:hypothetical protein
MSRYKKWAEHEYSKLQWIIALLFEGILLVVVIPFFIVKMAFYFDRLLHIPQFVSMINFVCAIPLMVIGTLLALWAIYTHFVSSQETPAPMMPTKKLVVKKPFTYCRNPMSLGTHGNWRCLPH